MKRRGFLGFLFGAPAGAAAAVAVGDQVPQPEAGEWGVRMLDLGAEPFPNAKRMPVDCDFSETAVLDALTHLPRGVTPLKVEVVIGYAYLVEAKRMRAALAPAPAVAITVNTNPAWQNYRWALCCAGHVIASSPGA